MPKSTQFRALPQAAILPTVAVLLASMASPSFAKALSFEVLYNFTDGADGGSPYSGLLADNAGNLYGTTGYGGDDNLGVVFKLAPDGTETVLHSFTGGQAGGSPVAGLIQDPTGNLYGTTGGNGDAASVVFELAPDGTYTVLHDFTNGSDGGFPNGSLLLDKKGNLYGTGVYGGAYGNGVVFELAPNGAETVLYSFSGGNDGGSPYCNVIRDKAGNLYGTASAGGADGAGVVFELAPNGAYTVLHSFTNAYDGGTPFAGLIMDKAGDLYGTAALGGAYGYGAVFKIAPGGAFTTLYYFTGGNDGGNPESNLTLDGAGNLYGTTLFGGADDNGVAFKLAPDGTETVLHGFTGGDDGGLTTSNLIKDPGQAGGYLYGTATLGGADGYGVVFKVKK